MKVTQLHSYQKRIANFIALHPCCVLSVDMGLGKTAATLAWLAWKRPATCLIVAPKRVAENNWHTEAEKWELADVAAKMVVVKGTPAKREAALRDADHPYKILSRDNLGDLKKYGFESFEALILDELTSYKNPDSARTRAVCRIEARHRIGLTGTFLANGEVDIYGQCAAVGLAERWNCPNFYAWRSAFFRDVLKGAGLQFSKWKLNVPLDNLLLPVRDSIFTLTADDYLEIPAVTETTHALDLDPETRRAVMDMDAFLTCDLDGRLVSIDEKAKFAKLQTLANGFVYVAHHDGETEAVRGKRSAKLESVADLVADCKEAGEPVLLFYAFREEALWLADLLKERGVKVESVAAKDFVKRWNAGEIECLFAHPASAGHGLNLQFGGRVIVWSTLTYNYELFAQGNARLARQGQTRNVQIHYFVAKDTTEERVVKALTDKQAAQTKFLTLTKQ